MRAAVMMLVLSLLARNAISQCCSANPVAGNVNVGMLSKHSVRIISFYRGSYSDTYYTGSKRSDLHLLKYGSYNYVGAVLAYGLTDKITIDTELGYYINKSEVFNIQPVFILKGSGFNNSVISIKYPVYRKIEEAVEITAGLGAKIPFTREPLEVDGVRLPQTVNPSTGAYGAVAQLLLYKGYIEKGWRFFLLSRFETNAANQIAYRFGDSYVSSLFVSKSFKNRFSGILQIRNENRTRDTRDGKAVVGSGGYLIFVAPQMVYRLQPKWNFSILVDFPVYRNYNGTQLSNKAAAAVTVMRDISW